MVALLALPLSACELVFPRPDLVAAAQPAPGVETRCTEACTSKADACSRAQCARGCRLVLDKLVEKEGPRVISCVARMTRKPSSSKAAKAVACGDVAFADCAAQSGPYAGGGPLPPRPPSDDDGDEP